MTTHTHSKETPRYRYITWTNNPWKACGGLLDLRVSQVDGAVTVLYYILVNSQVGPGGGAHVELWRGSSMLEVMSYNLYTRHHHMYLKQDNILKGKMLRL